MSSEDRHRAPKVSGSRCDPEAGAGLEKAEPGVGSSVKDTGSRKARRSKEGRS